MRAPARPVSPVAGMGRTAAWSGTWAQAPVKLPHTLRQLARANEGSFAARRHNLLFPDRLDLLWRRAVNHQCSLSAASAADDQSRLAYRELFRCLGVPSRCVGCMEDIAA
jgi:hypothetical protein